MLTVSDIKLKEVTACQLEETAKTLERYMIHLAENLEFHEKHGLFIISILNEVWLKFSKKALTKRGKKPFSQNLKYYEAYALHNAMMNVELSFETQLLLNQLDQKLA